MNLIVPENKKTGSIWLGNYKSALDPLFLKEHEISVIINCTADLPYIYDVIDPIEHGLQRLETFRIPVYDSLLDHDIYIMEEYLHVVLPFILKKCLSEHKNILIQCHAGAQRSAAVVASVLFVLIDNNIMTFEEIPNKKDKSKLMQHIIKYILEKRPRAFSYGFRVNFKTSLESFFNIRI